MSATLLRLSPSPRFAALIVAVHCAAAAAAWAALRGPAGAALAAGLVALGLAAAWSRALLRSGTAVRSVELGADGVVLQRADGSRLASAAAKRQYVSRFAVALVLAGPRRRTIFVTRDMLDAGAFRALRLWALWGRVPGAGRPGGVAGAQLHG